MLNVVPNSLVDDLPKCEAIGIGDSIRIQVSGRWTLASLAQVYAVATAARTTLQAQRASEFDLAGLRMLDTAGALALVNLRKDLAGSNVAFANARAEHRILLEEVSRAASAPAEQAPVGRPVIEFITNFVAGATAILRGAFRLTMFLGECSAALGRVVSRPSRFRGRSFIHQLQQTGVSAVPIISLVCFLLGGVVLQQGARQLRSFGAETLSIDMLGILSLREVGIVLAAVMMAGRSASAFTAQIGTMKMREEIDAMRTLGIDPIETLVVPRILALIVALPLLAFVADIMCLLGGAIMAKFYLSLDLPIYLQRLTTAVDAKHFYVGLIKAPFAGLVIGLVGCLEGLSVEGSAESVGTQVTTAVVKAIFLVLILDGIFAIFLSASGF
jgi:phospholipid/cholesterol/gamma-HCH transport system permease protein